MKATIADIRMLINNTMTKRHMQAAIKATADFTAKFHDRVQQIASIVQPTTPVNVPAQDTPANGVPPVATIIPPEPSLDTPKPQASPDAMVGGPAEPPAARGMRV